MDQVRAIAKVIWEQRFWVLSAIGLIVAVVCWNMASGDLDAKFSQRKSTIDGAFSAMQGLKGKANHPNQGVNDKNQEQVVKQTEIVNAVWKDLYNRQKESVLKWPKELGQDFISYIEKLKFRDPIDSRMRSIYQNYIGKRFDGLLDIVKAQKMADGSGMMGGGGREFEGERGGMPMVAAAIPGVDEDYLVQWLDQDKLRAKLAFATSRPTATQIWVTQEDLWVYETLLNVIAKTNEARGATRPDNTAIRVIATLQVGAGASQGPTSAAQIFMPQAAGVGGDMMGGRGGDMMSAEGADMSGRGGDMISAEGGFGPEGGDPAAMDSALLASRYLDDAGTPLPGEGDFGKEYRQLPIRMDLIMDQRYIPRLLVECANSPLPIEVKQVRINPDKALAGFGSQGGGSMNYSNSSVTLPNDPSLAQVEIKGSVFIYNEPSADPNAEPAPVDGQIAVQ